MSSESKLALRLEVDPKAPLVARRHISSFTTGLSEEIRANLALLVSELVTNSLRHASLGAEAWIHLTATIGPDAVRVEVADPGHSFPPAPDLDGEGGWGLLLVDRVASRWGVDRGRDALTRVWFEADLPDGERGWEELLAVWPEATRRTVRSIIGVLGTPQVATEQVFVWDGDDGCRFVIERDDEPAR